MTGTLNPGGSRLPRRAELMAAAHEMFGARGYHATSMSDIAERVGVSKPVLYRHFSGKLGLYQALAQDAAEELVTTVRAAVRASSGNASRVDAVVRSYFDVIASRDGVARLLFDIDGRTSPEIAAVIEEATASCVEEIGAVVREETGLGDEEARLLAAGLVGMGMATARYWFATGRTGREDSVGLTSYLAWRGIAGFPRQEPGADQVSPERRT